jgi:isopentenyl-diphosphate delta-isomerase
VSGNSFTPWFKLIARDLLFPWWDEMLAKSAEKGGKVDAKVLRGKVEGNGPVLKLV